MAVLRWRFTDGDGVQYVVPRNPVSMTNPLPDKNLLVKATTALQGGQAILIEGNRQPKDWSFTGVTIDAAHYEALRHWVLDVEGRVTIRDHFGRDLVVYLQKFDAVPERKVNAYWRHTYTISGLVFDVGAPTVGDTAP